MLAQNERRDCSGNLTRGMHIDISTLSSEAEAQRHVQLRQYPYVHLSAINGVWEYGSIGRLARAARLPSAACSSPTACAAGQLPCLKQSDGSREDAI